MKDNLTVLVADDDPVSLQLLRKILEKQGFSVVTAPDGIQAQKMIETDAVDLIIADYKMPKLDGLELLKHVKEQTGDIPFIMVTAYGGIDSTLQAFDLGAAEYITKPFDPAEIVIVAQKALNIGKIRRKLSHLEHEVQTKYHFDGLIGQSPLMRTVFNKIHKAAQSTAHVLITGETGTGKELTARAIHYNSARKNGPFVPVNCSAFSSGTLESELFGHVKGAFTDAYRDHPGRFQRAHQGTLFLDEIGDIAPEIQIKLLRVLQDRTFEPVGSRETAYADFRLITATHQNLKQQLQKNRFREDLYYRLRVINIEIPALRHHPEDIPLLIRHFLKAYSRSHNKPIQTISIEALKQMQRYPWPGNVRQLENAIESAVAMCDAAMIRSSDLPFEIRALPSENRDTVTLPDSSLTEAVAQLEIKMIRRALNQHGWIKARAAKSLGVNEKVLSYKMSKYRIDSPEKR